MATKNPFAGPTPAKAPDIPTPAKPKAKTAKAPKPPPDKVRASDPVQSAVLMLVTGMTPPAATAALEAKLGQNPEDAEKAVTSAQEQITLAASVDRVKEVGIAYHRLNNLYAQANARHDHSTALSAQRELNKLLDLYRQLGFNPSGLDDDADRAELDLIREHLSRLGLAPPDTSTPELARLAAARIIELAAIAK